MTLGLEHLTGVLEALAHPARLRLLALCQHGELTVKELTEATGMSQPRVSRHLRILVEAGVLRRFREAHWVYYRLRLEDEAAALARAALARGAATDPTLQTDARRLDAVLAARAKELRAAAGEDAEEILSPMAWLRVEQTIRQLAATARRADGLGNLLDIGTGSGRMLRILGPDARRAEGVDISHAMRLKARAALREAGLAHCSVKAGDMHRLPFTDHQFDTAVFGHVLTCSEEPWTAVREAARVLKPDGRLLVMELLPDGMPVEAWSQSLSDWVAAAGLETAIKENLALPGATAILQLHGRAALPETINLADIG